MIPFLKDVSKHFPESILIQKKIAEEDEKFLNSILEEYMNSIKKGKNYFELELIKWKNLSLSIKFRALNKIFKELGKNLTSKSLIKIIHLLDNAKEGFIGKIDFIELYKLKDKLLIKSQEKFEEYNFTLEIPGNLKLPSGEKIIAEVLDRESVKNINFQNPFQVYFDYDKINLDKLIIRTWKKGDRFKPFGLQGKSKKLQDFFVDKKIPRFQRNMIPLILGNNEILWIVGLARSDIAKIDENTKNILSIRVEREVKN
jgi:tRNA(Ile)-lysidine synthase